MDKFEDLVKSPLSLILLLNEHAQLKKRFRLEKTCVKTLSNDHCPKYSY